MSSSKLDPYRYPPGTLLAWIDRYYLVLGWSYEGPTRYPRATLLASDSTLINVTLNGVKDLHVVTLGRER